MATGSEVVTVNVIKLVEGDNFFEALGLWFSNISGIEFLILLLLNLTVLAFFLFRKHIKRFATIPANGAPPEEHFYSRSGNLRTFFGVEVGTMLQASETIEPGGKFGGKIKYRGLYWRARATETIEPGDTVEIVGRDVLTLLVRKSNRVFSSQYHLYA